MPFAKSLLKLCNRTGGGQCSIERVFRAYTAEGTGFRLKAAHKIESNHACDSRCGRHYTAELRVYLSGFRKVFVLISRTECAIGQTLSPFSLNPAVEANWQAEIRLEMDRSAVSAKAETHGKHIR
jgi:hypothetical protein